MHVTYSYETKRLIQLADQFLNEYCKDKQIFVTTHAKEFLALQDDIKQKEHKISIYRVY